jgi:hypothetical protein
MRLEYTLTLADYQAAQYLHWHQTPARRFIHFFVYHGIPVLLAASACTVAKRFGIFGLRISYSLEFISSGAIAALYVTVTAKGREIKRYIKRFESKYPPNERTALLEVDGSGILGCLGSDKESFEWSSIICAAQDERITLLYIAKNRFLFFPTTAMGSEERAELDRLVAEHLAGRATC